MNLVFSDIFKENAVFQRVSKEQFELLVIFIVPHFLQEICKMNRSEFTKKQLN
jgi:hypothetical protein